MPRRKVSTGLSAGAAFPNYSTAHSPPTPLAALGVLYEGACSPIRQTLPPSLLYGSSGATSGDLAQSRSWSCPLGHSIPLQEPQFPC